MPQYTFKCPKCGNEQTVTRVMADYDLPLNCEKDGKLMGRILLFNGRNKGCDAYPMASYAIGVDPSEVPAMREIDAKAGVKTEYSADGDPIFVSRGHRKQYLKAHGFHDRNSYDGH